jgi:hypothetical protein
MKTLTTLALILFAYSQQAFPLTFNEAFVAMRNNGKTISIPGIPYQYQKVDISCVTVPTGYIKETEAYLRLNAAAGRAGFANPIIDIKVSGRSDWVAQ